MKTGLTGKYFHSVTSDRKTIEWQGKFLSLVSPGLYRVQLFEWFLGSPSDQLLVPTTDMHYWLIYETQEEMVNHYYDDYYPRRERREQQEQQEQRDARAAKENIQ